MSQLLPEPNLSAARSFDQSGVIDRGYGRSDLAGRRRVVGRPYWSGVVSYRGAGLVRVLIVEDEVLLARTVKDGLVAEGFVVEVASDGVTGVWAATEGTFDVIILDIMLPQLNGYDVLKQLRAREIWTPVLMLTAKDGEYDQTDAFDLGADDYLTKPFSFMILVARLNALVRRGASERPVILSVGSLSLDPTRRLVTRRNVPIAMTAREYGLLHFMMRHAGDVISKMEILENVWDPAYDGPENIVEVYIGYLRRKIDAPFGVTTLRTVRGLGYCLDPDASDGDVVGRPATPSESTMPSRSRPGRGSRRRP